MGPCVHITVQTSRWHEIVLYYILVGGLSVWLPVFILSYVVSIKPSTLAYLLFLLYFSSLPFPPPQLPLLQKNAYLHRVIFFFLSSFSDRDRGESSVP